MGIGLLMLFGGVAVCIYLVVPAEGTNAGSPRVQAVGSGIEAVLKVIMLGVVLVLAFILLKACLKDDSDAEACASLYGGFYSPVDEGGNVYCENSFNGDRILLR